MSKTSLAQWVFPFPETYVALAPKRLCTNENRLREKAVSVRFKDECMYLYARKIAFSIKVFFTLFLETVRCVCISMFDSSKGRNPVKLIVGWENTAHWKKEKAPRPRDALCVLMTLQIRHKKYHRER